ncbi:MAG: (2Fe-2S)-binding protein [Actinobacteria bacterium]|nr:(2Fe-2S)-binding protein [Actinomycetota bacterium]
MYACICTAVTVDQVDQAIGAGAETIEAIGACTTAGTTCGSCHETLADLIEERCGSCPLASLAVA